jgi:hypothetical protein
MELNGIRAINVGIAVEESLTQCKGILFLHILVVQCLTGNKPLIFNNKN